MKTASHTDDPGATNLRLVSGIGLVDLARPDLPERLAGRVGEQLERFAGPDAPRAVGRVVSIGKL